MVITLPNHPDSYKYRLCIYAMIAASHHAKSLTGHVKVPGLHYAMYGILS